MNFDQSKHLLTAKSSVGEDMLTQGKFWLLFLNFCKTSQLTKKIEVKKDSELIA